MAASAGLKTFTDAMAREGDGKGGTYPVDRPTGKTKDWSAYFKSEGEARQLARQKLGKDPVEIEPGKWRSRDGKWQYRAKPGDIQERHIHLEELDPKTGTVLQNAHLRWPQGGGDEKVLCVTY